MIKTKNTPLWVFLAFSSIESRKGAIMLITACILFTAYCIPWVTLIRSEGTLLGSIFLIDDWSWAGMMIPICLWYIACLKWMDKHDGWTRRPAGMDI